MANAKKKKFFKFLVFDIIGSENVAIFTFVKKRRIVIESQWVNKES